VVRAVKQYKNYPTVPSISGIVIIGVFVSNLLLRKIFWLRVMIQKVTSLVGESQGWFRKLL
ncbi:MAG: hypothetical protein AAFX96_13725, partial [Pseudomonadota bacterium]